MNDNILFGIRFIIVILMVSIFLILSKNYVENFKNQDDEIANQVNQYNAYNTRMTYRNTGALPWERHNIYSSLPVDIKVKYKNAYFYEYGNDEYTLKLREIFNNKCEKLIMVVEGTNWTKWYNPKNNNKPDILLTYYNNIYNFIYNSINKSDILNLPNNDPPLKIQIVHDILKRYKQNIDDPSYYLFDIELVLYREGKIQGKHFKFIVLSDNKSINVVVIKLIGVVSEDNISMHPVLPNDQYNDMNSNFDIFIPQKNVKDDNIDKNKPVNFDVIYSHNETLSNNEIEDKLYNKLVNSYDPEEDDIYNNNYHSSDDNLFSTFINADTEEAKKQISDLQKNINNTKATAMFRKQFLDNLNKPIDETKNSNNIYKNYPYTDDMVAVTNYNDSYSEYDDKFVEVYKL
jgi:hypothetical protein